MTTFTDCILKSHPTGSRYICNPAPTDTDNDTVFLVNGFYDWVNTLRNEGWEDCGPDYEETGRFRAFRKGEENFICTEEEDFYLSYVKATEGAKALNLLNKEDRIKLFHTVLLTDIDGFRDPLQTRAVFDVIGDVYINLEI